MKKNNYQRSANRTKKVVLAVGVAAIVVCGTGYGVTETIELNKAQEKIFKQQSLIDGIKKNNHKLNVVIDEKEDRIILFENQAEILRRTNVSLKNKLNKEKTYSESLKKKLKEQENKKSNAHNGWRRMVVNSSAYSTYEAGDSLSGRQWGGRTASGSVPKQGRTIAVDRSIIPFGTKVYIPALNATLIAEDTGSAIKGNRVDIFFGTVSECMNWGRRTIEIYVENK
jgi:3D (Asp-Asp-Asp) domain-containing protein